jgi:hypothetical protein
MVMKNLMELKLELEMEQLSRLSEICYEQIPNIEQTIEDKKAQAAGLMYELNITVVDVDAMRSKLKDREDAARRMLTRLAKLKASSKRRKAR